MLTRRRFLRTTAATGVATAAGVSTPFGATYDLVIRGGRVIDPGRGLDSVMDVAVAGGKIAAVLPAGSVIEAARTFDASGTFVVPGLIDIHTHARSKEMPVICLSDGVTSLIDAGSQGADHIDDVVTVAKGVRRSVESAGRPGEEASSHPRRGPSCRCVPR